MHGEYFAVICYSGNTCRARSRIEHLRRLRPWAPVFASSRFLPRQRYPKSNGTQAICATQTPICISTARVPYLKGFLAVDAVPDAIHHKAVTVLICYYTQLYSCCRCSCSRSTHGSTRLPSFSKNSKPGGTCIRRVIFKRYLNYRAICSSTAQNY